MKIRRKNFCAGCVFSGTTRVVSARSSVGANAAECEQAKKARVEFLGTGNAQPDQRFKVVNKPVIARSLTVEVEEGQRWIKWQEVDGFTEANLTIDISWLILKPVKCVSVMACKDRRRNSDRGFAHGNIVTGGGAEGNLAPK